MTWVRISDDFMDHPKVLELGQDAPVALTLWLAGLGYANRYMTDGYIPAGILPRLTPLAPGDLKRAGDALLGVNLWEPASSGFEIHDYLDYQHSKAWILEHRQQAHDRGLKGAAVRYGVRDVDDSIDESIERSTPPHAAPNPTQPNPNPTTNPPRFDEVVVEYRGLFGHVTDAKRLYLADISSRWPVDRVLEGLRVEQRNGATSKTICGRLETGLKGGDKARGVVAFQAIGDVLDGVA